MTVTSESLSHWLSMHSGRYDQRKLKSTLHWPYLPVFFFFFNTWTIDTSKDRKIEAFSQSFNDYISSYSGYTSNMMVKDSDFGPSFLTVTSSFDKATVDSLSQTSSFVQDRGLNPERILDQLLRPGFNNVQFRQAFAQWFFVLSFALSRSSPLHNETQENWLMLTISWLIYVSPQNLHLPFPRPSRSSLDFHYASVTVDQLGLAFLKSDSSHSTLTDNGCIFFRVIVFPGVHGMHFPEPHFLNSVSYLPKF